MTVLAPFILLAPIPLIFLIELISARIPPRKED
jgi:hypothetical protein